MSPTAYSTPRTWTDTELVTAAMLNQEVRDNENAAFPLGVDAWTSYTPTLAQNATVTKTVTYAKYQRVGRTIIVQVLLSVTGTGTAATAIDIGLPVTAAFAGNMAVGSGYLYDVSSNTTHKGVAMLQTTSTLRLLPTSVTTSNPMGVDSFSAALASGDAITAAFTYEAAS